MSWELFPGSTYEFTNVSLNTSPKTFNNLQGDKYDYKLITRLDGNTSDGALFIYFNDDNGTTDLNYREYVMYGTGTTTAILNNDSKANIQICNCGDTAGLYTGLSETYILGSSGNERVIEVLSGIYTGNVSYILLTNGSFKTTADEITKINISTSSTINTSGAFYLFRRLKTGQFNTNDWDLIEEVEVTAQNLNLFPIDFINLQGDQDIEYKLEAEFSTSTICNLFLLLQTGGAWDETQSNYTINAFYNTGGGVGGVTLGRPIDIGWQAGASDNLSVIHIINSAGHNPLIKCNSYSAYSSGIKQMSQSGWHVNSDEITGIRIKDPNGGKTFTGKFRLYKRSKKRSSYGKRKIYEYTVNGDFSTGDTFKNLKDDKLYEVEIDFVANGSSNYIDVFLNDETSYQYQTLYSNSGSVATGSGAYSKIQGARASLLAYPGIQRLLIMPKNTGNYRQVLETDTGLAGTVITQSSIWWWKNNTDDLTDITFKALNSTSVYGTIKIYEIDLK